MSVKPAAAQIAVRQPRLHTLLPPHHEPNGGLLSIDEVCERYDMALEEFASWQRAVDRSGIHGLRVTRIKQHRDRYERQQKY